jgi:L-methionine (R)-S-oxide reductase
MEKDKKNNRYERLYEQLSELLSGRGNAVARMATIAALLHHKMDYFFWTGFYLLDDGQLIVGPYQGPLACILLKKNTGVCWTAINRAETIIVPDVHKFPGHIACNPGSRSEIVIPLKKAGGDVYGVLDIDSREIASFDDTDRHWLSMITGLI